MLSIHIIEFSRQGLKIELGKCGLISGLISGLNEIKGTAQKIHIKLDHLYILFAFVPMMHVL